MPGERPRTKARARAALRRNRAARTAAALYRHRGCGPHDVILASYPKSGNTWLKFLLADVLLDSEPDFERSERAIPLLGRTAAGAAPLPGGGHLWKSHEPYSPLYRRRCPRAIYLVRDARDVAISEYHFLQRKGRFAGDLGRFLELFLAGRADGYGSWDAHVRSFTAGWRGEPEGRIIVRYEDMLADRAGALGRGCWGFSRSPRRPSGWRLRSSATRLRGCAPRRSWRPGETPQVRAGRPGSGSPSSPPSSGRASGRPCRSFAAWATRSRAWASTRTSGRAAPQALRAQLRRTRGGDRAPVPARPRRGAASEPPRMSASSSRRLPSSASGRSSSRSGSTSPRSATSPTTAALDDAVVPVGGPVLCDRRGGREHRRRARGHGRAPLLASALHAPALARALVLMAPAIPLRCGRDRAHVDQPRPRVDATLRLDRPAPRRSGQVHVRLRRGVPRVRRGRCGGRYALAALLPLIAATDRLRALHPGCRRACAGRRPGGPAILGLPVGHGALRRVAALGRLAHPRRDQRPGAGGGVLGLDQVRARRDRVRHARLDGPPATDRGVLRAQRARPAVAPLHLRDVPEHRSSACSRWRS